MLSDIRKNVAHPYIQVLLGLIIFVFIFFFGWSMQSGSGGPSGSEGALATVNGQPVTPAEYRNAYDGLVDFYQRLSQGALGAAQAKALGLEKRALDLVVDRALLMQEAAKLNFSVSNDEVKAAIESLPIFQENNLFSGARYHQVLKAQGLAPEQYEAMKRQELLLGKVEERLRAAAAVTDEDVEREYRDRNTRMSVDYVVFPAKDYTAKVAVTEGRLQDFLAKEPEAFRAEERRSARYVFFPVDDYASQIQVPEEELKQQYKVRAYQFQTPESVRLRQILVKVEPGASEAQIAKAKARAEELRAKVTGAAGFQELARRESDDPATKASGGEMGWIARGTFLPEFENAVFPLGVNEVSQPIQSQAGFHLLQVAERRAPRERGFDEVRGELLRALQRERAREVAFKAADAVLMDLEDKKATWDTLPGGRKALTSPLVSKLQQDPALPRSPKFQETLFSLTETSPGQLVETPEGTYLVSLRQVRPAGTPTLSEIRSAVEARFRVVEAKNLAKSAAEAFAAEAARSGWASAAAARKLTSATSQTFNNKGASLPPLGSSEEAKAALFEKPEAGRILAKAYEVDEGFAALRIAAVVPANLAGLEVEREKIRQDLLPSKREAAFEAEMEKLRKAAKIEILDPALREDAPTAAAK